MNKVVLTLTMTMLVLSLFATAGSHPATERYIPIGYWSSISKTTQFYMGEIESHNAIDHSMSVRSSSGSRKVMLTDKTNIWLDRSAAQMENLKGSYSDCVPGRTIEVRFSEGTANEAKWVKVRIDRP